MTGIAAREARDRKMVAYYKAGHSMAKTAARFAVSIGTVYRILERDCPADIRRNPRPCDPPEREARDREIIAFYRAGNGTKKTAARFGLKCHTTVLDILYRDCPHDVRPVGQYWRGPVPDETEAEYRRTKAAERARQDAEIEKLWPEKDAYSHRREAGA
jgi:hypothetical protein